MLNIKELENGDLELSIPNKDDRDDINYQSNHWGYWTVMANLFEEFACNGSYTHFDSAEVSIGLTNSPAIAEDMDIDDDGNQTIVGRTWYFADYMTQCEIELMADGEKVIYTLIK